MRDTSGADSTNVLSTAHGRSVYIAQAWEESRLYTGNIMN